MPGKFKYVFITHDGDTLPIAAKLQDEGEKVYVSQTEDGKMLAGSWISEEESPELKRRRLSLYDGILKKHPIEKMLRVLREVKNKDDYFFVFGFNSLYPIAEAVLKMGFTKGLFPTKEDFDREKERQASKDFVKKNYGGKIKVGETVEMNGVDNVIKFVEESDKIWCVKSDGNFGETIVPDHNDLEAAKAEVISELESDRAEYEKGKLVLEEKIPYAIEFAPQMAFWDGKPIYSQVEVETRMLGAGDTGPQTGGNLNLVVRTPLDCKLNQIAFPKAAMDLAKGRKGLFLLDCGILSDGEDMYFTEFAGNRWGWGGVFSELSAAETAGRMAVNYFEDVAEGINPQEYKYGANVAFYSLPSDPKHKEMIHGDLRVEIKERSRQNVFMVQTKQGKGGLVNVGYRDYASSPMGYAVGRGDTVEEAAGIAYRAVGDISFKGLYYRPKTDYLSREYASAVLNRLRFLEENGFIPSDNVFD